LAEVLLYRHFRGASISESFGVSQPGTAQACSILLVRFPQTGIARELRDNPPDYRRSEAD
jgi:hypothetical protein